MKFLLLLVLFGFAHSNPDFELEVFSKTSQYVRDYTSTRSVPDVHKYIPEDAKILIKYAKRYFHEKKMLAAPPKAVLDLTCSACVGAVGSVIFDYQTLGLSLETLIKLLVPLCSVVLDHDVCQGAVNNYAPEIKWIMDNRGIKAKRFCSIMLGGRCGDWEEVNGWDVSIPDGKPEPQDPVLPPNGSQSYKVLHLSDIHLDLSYKIGATSVCDLPMCCSNHTAMTDDPAKAAGYWGSYNCDLPYWTFEDMLLNIQEQHGDEIDYIMITGDYPAHDVWLQSRRSNLEHTRTVHDLVTKVFPDKMILPGVGNHESFPCNSYPPKDLDVPEFSIQWLYGELAEYYSSWIPEDLRPEFMEQFSQNGYYTLKIRPGLRLAMINPNGCLGYNFWLNYNWVDSSGALQWLVSVLAEAEAAGEKVHIMSHIPPGNNDCLGGWGRNYARIIERFENTVVAQFFGHTHNDQFVVFYDSQTKSRPLNVGFVTPSVTTYTGMNPAYVIYTVDGPSQEASYRVLEKEVYIFRLSEANTNVSEKPRYFKLYDARNDLEMDSLFPRDYDKVVHRLAEDDDYYAKYFRYYNHDSTGDDDTRRAVVCKMVTIDNTDSSKCEELMGTQ